MPGRRPSQRAAPRPRYAASNLQPHSTTGQAAPLIPCWPVGWQSHRQPACIWMGSEAVDGDSLKLDRSAIMSRVNWTLGPPAPRRAPSTSQRLVRLATQTGRQNYLPPTPVPFCSLLLLLPPSSPSPRPCPFRPGYHAYGFAVSLTYRPGMAVRTSCSLRWKATSLPADTQLHSHRP